MPRASGPHDPARIRHSLDIPDFGDFADLRNVATAAVAAEQAGWDGLFVRDHVLRRRHQGRPFGDPWMVPTAAALATSRIRLGRLLTPVPRYRPGRLARQVTTLDRLSGGRVALAAGPGGPVDDEYRDFGDAAAPRELAGRLDEGLDLLRRYGTGEPVDHRGAVRARRAEAGAEGPFAFVLGGPCPRTRPGPVASSGR